MCTRFDLHLQMAETQQGSKSTYNCSINSNYLDRVAVRFPNELFTGPNWDHVEIFLVRCLIRSHAVTHKNIKLINIPLQKYSQIILSSFFVPKY